MKRLILALLLVAGLSGPAAADFTAQISFFRQLTALCGKSFEGRVASTDPADKDFADKRLVMRVAACTDREVRIPFAVGDDRSRTWVITMLDATQVRLKHDHRHEDGSEDVLSNYGGDSNGSGSSWRQEFPADAFSQTLFREKGNPVSVDNVWAVEVTDTLFAYELRRPNRHFRVEFDLTRPLAE
jgi:hypothetical protein